MKWPEYTNFNTIQVIFDVVIVCEGVQKLKKCGKHFREKHKNILLIFFFVVGLVMARNRFAKR